MGIGYRCDADLGLVVSVWDGDVTPEDVRQHIVDLAADADWPPGPLHLSDLSTIRRATVPDAELVDLLYECTNLAEPIRIAVLVHPKVLGVDAARYGFAADHVGASTFGDLADACAHLEIPVERVSASIADARAAIVTRAAGSVTE